MPIRKQRLSGVFRPTVLFQPICKIIERPENRTYRRTFAHILVNLERSSLSGWQVVEGFVVSTGQHFAIIIYRMVPIRRNSNNFDTHRVSSFQR